MTKRTIALGLILIMILGLFAGCKGDGKSDAVTTPAETTAPADPVTLTIAGPWRDCKAIEETGRAFTAQYPNCTVVYEYLQDYYASLEKRMEGEAPVDLFISLKVSSDSNETAALLPYALDLKSADNVDLSETFDGLIENFVTKGDDGTDKLYTIPLGAEMRGLFINKTLLDSLSIAVPTDQTSLLAACAKLKEAGYIPFQGNPGAFAQHLVYPWICNIIANSDNFEETHAKVEAHEAGMSEMFSEPLQFIYTLIENGYYDYKKSETDLGLFKDASNEGYTRDFLNIKKSDNGTPEDEGDDTWEKADDIGKVAFMPSTLSLKSEIDKAIDDYHSGIEYAFVPSPVSNDGGFVYLSPAHGISVNKTAANTDWSVKFIDFLFKAENNEAFAKSFNTMPNTKGAFDYISTLFDIPETNISHVGQATFSYGFYKMITTSLIEISKGNNPKYMKQNDDGTSSLYPFDYYMANLEASIAEQ